MRNMLYIAAVLITGGVIAAISFSGQTQTNTSDRQPQTNAIKLVQEMQVTDHLGHSITIEKPIKRIVSTYSALTEDLVFLGAREMIVGASHKQAHELKIQAVGSHIRPDIESILACKPDLVLFAASRKSMVEKLSPILKANNIHYLSFYPRTVDQSMETLTILGKLSGHPVSDEYIASSKKLLLEIEKKVSAIPAEKRPTVFLEVNSNKMLTCGKRTFAYDVITKAGGIPLSDQNRTVHAIDLEQLFIKQPNYYIQQLGAMNKNPQSPAERDIIKDLKCIKNNKFSRIDEALISRPGPRAVEAVKAVHSLLFN